MSNIIVSPARPDDIPDIMRLIVELAVYEKEPDAVTATEEQLRVNIFEQKHANVILARLGSEQGEVIGMALYFFNFSTWLGIPGLYLEDLYVSPAHRNTGIGKLLFGHLGRIALEKGCGRLEWRVLKWNAPSIAFYEKVLGAHPQSEWEGMRLEGAEEIGGLSRFMPKD